jgi:predicted dehydrogenase
LRFGDFKEIQMALDLTPEQRQLGQDNYARAVEGMTRRRFLKGTAAAAGAAALVTPAVYFGYKAMDGKPVKAALIGGGDEGGVLVGEHNPDFLEFIAVCDLRPFNLTIDANGRGGGRIFDGDPKTALRKGFKKVYGSKANGIKPYRDFEQMLRENKDIEAVVIATPLVTHAPIAIKCMQIGKERKKPIHVLCEKLMARTIGECKEMIAVARETGSLLSIGHQRHYSMLYSHAHEIVDSGVLGDIKHIRALWHRNFTWPYKPEADLEVADVPDAIPKIRDGWYQPILKADYDELKDKLARYVGKYKDIHELVRWRIYDRTGGGLMAELGSHQLDACSIFLGHVHPLSVQGVGTHSFFGHLDKEGKPVDDKPNPREIDDHIHVTFEFPGKNHPQGAWKGKDPSDVVVVSYSSVSTNQFEQYGECLMGSRGSMVVEGEQKVFLFPEKDPAAKGGDPKSTAIGVTTTGGKPAIDSGGTWGPAAPAGGAGAGQLAAGAGSAPLSRGYREEMEDFAYCARLWDPKLSYATKSDGTFQQRVTRCHGTVAMADAIIAMTASKAMRTRDRIEFKSEWFDPDLKDKVPEKS